MTVPSYRLLGVQVHELTIPDLVAKTVEAAESHQPRIMAHHNLHSLYLYHHYAKLRDFYSHPQYTFIDGMSLILLGRLLGLPLRRRHRLTAVDWMHSILPEVVQRSWRVFYLGSSPSVAAQGAQVLRDRFPGLQIKTYHGFFDLAPRTEENQRVLDMIEDYRPHLLLVGMGVPKQEYWVLDNLARIRAGVIFSIGAYMDYVAGKIPTPPRWAGKLGLEWLFRLLSEPKRLWRRYLIEPWFVLKLFAVDVFRNARHTS